MFVCQVASLNCLCPPWRNLISLIYYLFLEWRNLLTISQDMTACDLFYSVFPFDDFSKRKILSFYGKYNTPVIYNSLYDWMKVAGLFLLKHFFLRNQVQAILYVLGYAYSFRSCGDYKLHLELRARSYYSYRSIQFNMSWLMFSSQRILNSILRQRHGKSLFWDEIYWRMDQRTTNALLSIISD